MAVLLGGNEFRIQKYDRDEEMIQHIIQMEEHFWYEYMLKDTPPEAAAKDNEILGQLYPKSETKAIEMPTKAREVLADYEKASQDLAMAKEKKEEAQVQLLHTLFDPEKNAISYTVKVTLISSDGEPVTEALGAANTLEPKFVKGGMGSQNLVVSQAVKRATVSAVKTLIC